MLGFTGRRGGDTARLGPVGVLITGGNSFELYRRTLFYFVIFLFMFYNNDNNGTSTYRERTECMVCCSREREREKGREYMLYGVILCMFACVFMLLCLANKYVYIYIYVQYIGYT